MRNISESSSMQTREKLFSPLFFQRLQKKPALYWNKQETIQQAIAEYRSLLNARLRSLSSHRHNTFYLCPEQLGLRDYAQFFTNNDILEKKVAQDLKKTLVSFDFRLYNISVDARHEKKDFQVRISADLLLGSFVSKISFKI